MGMEKFFTVNLGVTVLFSTSVWHLQQWVALTCNKKKYKGPVLITSKFFLEIVKYTWCVKLSWWMPVEQVRDVIVKTVIKLAVRTQILTIHTRKMSIWKEIYSGKGIIFFVSHVSWFESVLRLKECVLFLLLTLAFVNVTHSDQISFFKVYERFKLCSYAHCYGHSI